MIKRVNINRNFLVISILIFLVLLSFGAVIAFNEIALNLSSDQNVSVNFINSTNYNLNEGKNLVYFESYNTAKGLIMKNPEIETISYYDEFSDKTIGYVNIFGGIGKDFTIYPGKLYEINAKRQISLNLN